MVPQFCNWSCDKISEKYDIDCNILLSEEPSHSTSKNEEQSLVISCPRCPQIFTALKNLKNHMFARHYKRPGSYRPSKQYLHFLETFQLKLFILFSWVISYFSLFKDFGWKKSSVYADYYKATDDYRRRKLALSQPHETMGGDRDIEQPPTWHLNEDFNNSVKTVRAQSPPRVLRPLRQSGEMSPPYTWDSTKTSVRDIPLPPHGKSFWEI